MQKLLFTLIFTLIGLTNYHHSHAATANEYPWNNFIDGTVGKPYYYLYNQVLNILPPFNRTPRALDLGSGAGDMDVDLVANGWEVTGIDTTARSGEIITERVKLLKGSFQFQQCDFSSAILSGQYDVVISMFSLPYGKKQNLPILLKNISQHMPSGGILALNFFGPNHTWVKSNEAYGMTKDELFGYLAANHFMVKFFLNRIYDQRDFDKHAIHWDVLDIIAIKE